MNYYGQQGEDYILWDIFKDQTSGTFVDVGAFDGMQYSNTYGFELAGWGGLCVEAHPAYIKFLKKNRPNSINVHGAASTENKPKVTFFTCKYGPLSTLDKSVENQFKKQFPKHFKGFSKTTVPMYTLNNLLKRNNIEKIDFISIDTEGTELDVLKGLDIEKYAPRVILAECMEPVRINRVIKYLTPKGYRLARGQSNNFFFCKTEEDAITIANSDVSQARGRVIHTKHPIKALR